MNQRQADKVAMRAVAALIREQVKNPYSDLWFAANVIDRDDEARTRRGFEFLANNLERRGATS